MSNRAWYYAAQGQQQGPISEEQLRDFITRGVVTADTLVWTEGMAGWEKAGRIPGLISDVADQSPALPPDFAADSEGPLWVDLDLWTFLGWAVLFVIGAAFIIPAPWTATYFYRYVIERIHVPGRGPLAFTGQPLDIWYVFIGLGVLSYVGTSHRAILELLALVGQAFLSWMVIRWLAANIVADKRAAEIRFEGSPLAYVGW